MIFPRLLGTLKGKSTNFEGKFFLLTRQVNVMNLTKNRRLGRLILYDISIVLIIYIYAAIYLN